MSLKYSLFIAVLLTVIAFILMPEIGIWKYIGLLSFISSLLLPRIPK